MPEYVLIAGTSFCGSTLLAMLLDLHPEMASIGELQFDADPHDYHCSCSATIAECPFWRDVKNGIADRDVRFSLDKWGLMFELSRSRIARQLLVRSLRHNVLDDARDEVVRMISAWRTGLELIGKRNEAFTASVLSVAGKSVFVDASKDPIRARFLERYTNIEPKVIHLVRDSLGFVSSHMKNVHATLQSGISRWNRMAGHCVRLFDRLPHDRRLRVRYEDLCSEPESELNRIAAFAGVAGFPWPFDYVKEEHHVLGNRMRHKPLKTIALDESWRERLASDQFETITRKTSVYRQAFGYV